MVWFSHVITSETLLFLDDLKKVRIHEHSLYSKQELHMVAVGKDSNLKVWSLGSQSKILHLPSHHPPLKQDPTEALPSSSVSVVPALSKISRGANVVPDLLFEAKRLRHDSLNLPIPLTFTVAPLST